MDAKIVTIFFGLFAVSFADLKVDQTIDAIDLEPARKYFSERWRKIYSAKMLENQPKWRISDNQPEDAAYECRDYENAYWISSHAPCWEQDDASSKGYFNIFFYLMGFNYQRFTYDLTYPIITRVEQNVKIDEPKKKRRGKKGRKPKRCPTRYTSMSYLKAESDSEVATPAGETLKTELIMKRTVYIKEYFKDDTSEYCNEQAAILAQSLTEDGVEFNSDDWYCAKYIPGLMEIQNRFEVWFVGTEPEEEPEETEEDEEPM